MFKKMRLRISAKNSKMKKKENSKSEVNFLYRCNRRVQIV